MSKYKSGAENTPKMAVQVWDKGNRAMIRRLLSSFMILFFMQVMYSPELAGDETINRHVFTGKEYDSNTGLIYFGARYYDPDTGRFITQDDYQGEPAVPPSLNRYLYSYNNPTVFFDLFGHESVSTMIDNAAGTCNGAGCYGWAFLKTFYTVGTVGFASVHDPQRDAYDAGKIGGTEYVVKGIGGGGAVVAANVVTGRMAGAAMAGKSLLTQTVIGASTGAGIGALNDAAAQVSNIDAGSQQKYDYRQTAVSTIVGSSIGGAAPAAGAFVQKMSAQMAQARAQSFLTGESRAGYEAGERMSNGRLTGDGPKSALSNGPESAGTPGSKYSRRANVKYARAEDVNVTYPEGYHPPYKSGTRIAEFTTKSDEQFVRVHVGEGNKARSWLMRREAIEGLTPHQIQSKYSLPELPTHVSDVEVPGGTRIRAGKINPGLNGSTGNAVQYELLETIEEANFTNTRLLK